MAGMKEACQALCEVSVNLRTEEIQIEEAYGRVLSENVTARIAVPSFRRSAYDGYALRSEDIQEASKEHPVTLKVTETIPAGRVGKCPVTKGEAARIMTGAMVPEGADTVVKYEETSFTESEVRFFQPSEPGNIVYPGEDVQQNVCLIESGKIIGAADAAVMAGQGMRSVHVFQKPEIAVLSTGSELARQGRRCQKEKFIIRIHSSLQDIYEDME